MTLVTECPSWEYSGVDGYSVTLAFRAKELLRHIRSSDSIRRETLSKNTRPAHGAYFRGLTPAGFPHYAGNYRGQNLPCLSDYEVGIRVDGRVGHTAATVPLEMQEFGSNLDELYRQLNLMWPANERLFPREWKIYRSVELAAAAFVYFLEIHPYADGNGHMARMMLIVILARFDIFLARWPIDPRPPDPPYSDLIARYRNGDRTGLELFILNCI